MRDPESVADFDAGIKANPPPYPVELLPSRDPDSKFAEIVGICYEAAGGNPDPDRAIRNYLEIEQVQMSKARTAFEKGLKSA